MQTDRSGGHFDHEWRHDGDLIPKIVETIEANVGERAVADAGPIFDVINPDALQALFKPTAGGANRDVGAVTFQWADHDITVTANGEMTVTPVEDSQ